MCFSGTEEHLKAKYRSSLHQLEPIPGEEFSVSLDDKDLMMTANFESWEIDLASKENKDMIRHYKKLDSDKAVYKTLNISELGDVFKSVGDKAMNARNLQGNLITLIGDPGVGKTTAVQRLAWEWVKENSDISNRYKLVFFILVRHVRKDSLEDVLSELNLLPNPLSDGTQNLHDFAKDTLFILDGADENDITCDLHRLITGDLYPESTVLLTARPEATYLKSFPVLPRVKVTLVGTDGKTVDRYMREAVSPSSDEEWKSFEDYYKEKLPDTSLLKIPLYLCLLCAVFKAHIARGLKCTNSIIPETTTELFNAFLHVIIKRWLARINMNQTVSFEKSPLDPNSTVPVGHKTILYFIGKLCFKDLIQPTSNYQFTDAQAGECFLDIQDIKDCGLFNMGISGKHEIFYLKHKQLQEYLAALYLSSEGTKECSFHELLHSENNKGHFLFEVMSGFNAVKLVQFACGLSGDFLKSLLNIATSQFGIHHYKWYSHNFPDIHYEAALFIEHNSGELSDVRADDLPGFIELKKYLLDAPITRTLTFHGEHEVLSTDKCLHKLCGLFDKALKLQLLSRLYDLKQVGSGLSVKYEIEQHSGPEKMCFQLDQLQTELLNAVCMPSIQCLRVGKWRRCFVDIPGLLETFPHLSELLIYANDFIPYCSNLKSDRGMCTSLTSVTLKGYRFISGTLPESHVQSLLQQTQLSSLVLFSVNILPVLACTTQPLWSHLQQLSLNVHSTSDDDWTAICRLLHSSRHSLTQCDLQRLRFAEHLLPLTEETLKSLTQLQELSLLVFPNGQSYNLCDTLQRVLPYIKTLHTLAVAYSHVCDRLETLVETVCEYTNIRTLTLLTPDKGRELPQQWHEKLTQHGVKIEYKKFDHLLYFHLY